MKLSTLCFDLFSLLGERERERERERESSWRNGEKKRFCTKKNLVRGKGKNIYINFLPREKDFIKINTSEITSTRPAVMTSI